MLTPLDIESKAFKTALGGYSKSDVNQFMKEILGSYEKMYKENIEMKDKINMLNEGIGYYKTMEATLQNTLILAEKMAEDTRINARHKAETIEKEAEINASKLLQDSKEEVYKINQMLESMRKAYDANKIQIKQFLFAQLEMITKSELELDSGTTLADELMKRIKDINIPIIKENSPDMIEDTVVFENRME